MNENNSNMMLPEYAIVNPKLINDSLSKQGQIGFITGTNLDKDEFYLTFDDDQVRLYASDALLVLQYNKDITDIILGEQGSLTKEDFKTLLNIALLANYGSDKYKKEALKMALANQEITNIALTTPVEFIQSKYAYKPGR